VPVGEPERNGVLVVTPRFGLGPVFGNEWLTTSRRWQSYAGRAVFVAVPLVGLTSIWVGRTSRSSLPPIQAMAEIGRGFYNAIVLTQLTLVFLAAPAATAGAICQDKASGTLAQMLLTDLSDAEIVLGKLGARLVPVIGLVCCALPVLAIATLLGGIDPQALAGLFLITVGVAIFGCTLAFTFSIWGSKPYEVLLTTYAFFAVWQLAVPVGHLLTVLWRFPRLPRWATTTNPYSLALAPYEQPGKYGLIDDVALSAALLLISAALAVFAIRRMRNVIVRQADALASQRRSRTFSGARFGDLWSKVNRAPSLDDNPVLWYETHRQRPTPWLRNLVQLYFLLAIVFTLAAIADTFWLGPSTMRGWLPAFVAAFQVAMGLPLLLLAATTALVEERVRGSLEVLLTTPLSSRNIVLTKWWSVYRKVTRLLALPAILGAVLAWGSGRWFAAGLLVLYTLSGAALWTSIGLALSTWVPRLGRAVSIAAALYVLVSVGWPTLARTVYLENNLPLAAVLSAIGPFHATFDLTYSIEDPNYADANFACFPAWIVVQAVLALGLLLATLATFDRCLGRTPG
jgi:ABC-type transport system involved in multi-copper enzyme maturation permease subunit